MGSTLYRKSKKGRRNGTQNNRLLLLYSTVQWCNHSTAARSFWRFRWSVMRWRGLLKTNWRCRPCWCLVYMTFPCTEKGMIAYAVLGATIEKEKQTTANNTMRSTAVPLFVVRLKLTNDESSPLRQLCSSSRSQPVRSWRENKNKRETNHCLEFLLFSFTSLPRFDAQKKKWEKQRL